jgi:hypothetical protein
MVVKADLGKRSAPARDATIAEVQPGAVDIPTWEERLQCLQRRA